MLFSYLQIHEPHFGNNYSQDACMDLNKALLHCITVMGNNVNYLVYANVGAYYQNNWVKDNIHYSWLMANQLCQKNGVELLYFMSRSELDEFTSILRRTDTLPFLEAVFIGLIYNEFKVGLFETF